MASRFILTPVIISQVGLAGYGTWTLLFSIGAYGSMFNASFGFVYSKYTAEYDSQGKYDELASIIGSGIALVGSLSLIILSVLWTFRIAVLTYFNVDQHLLADAAVALTLLVFCLLLRMSLGCTFDVLSGLQRADLNYKLNLLGSIVEFSIALPLLIAKWGLLALGIGYASGQLVSTLLAFFLCRRICPQLRISPFRISRNGLRLVTSLGGRFQALSFMNIIFDQGVKLLISKFMGVSTVGVYELAYKLLGLGTTISSSLLGPLMPAFANLHAGEGAEQTRRLFLGSSKAVAITAGTALGFVALFADQLVFAWTGNQFPEAAWTLRALVPTQFLVMLTGVPTASLRGKGTLNLEMLFATVGTTGLVLAIMVARSVGAGYRGIIFARIFEDLSGACTFLWLFFRAERMSLFVYARDVFGRVAMCVLLAIGVVIAARSALPWITISGLPARWEAISSAVLWGTLFVLTAWTSAWFVVLSRDESQNLLSNARRLLRPGGAA